MTALTDTAVPWALQAQTATGRSSPAAPPPFLAPAPAMSCPALFTRSIPCGSSPPGLRHKPRLTLPLWATLVHQVGTRSSVLVQSSTRCEKGRRTHGEGHREKSRGGREIAYLVIKPHILLHAYKDFCFMHIKGLSFLIITSFFVFSVGEKAQVYLAISQLFVMEQ